MATTTEHIELKGQRRKLLFAVCVICYAFGGYFSTLMPVYLPVVVKELLNDTSIDNLSEVSAYIGSMFLLGWTFGGILFGILGDHIGRVKAFVMAVMLYSVLNIMISFSESWMMIIVLRFFSGIGVGGTLVLATILISEIWPTKSRAIALGVLAVTFPIGIISAGIANNLFADWRLAFLPGFVPLAAGLLALFLIKESTEWIQLKKEPADRERPSKYLSLFDTNNKTNLIHGSLIFGAMIIGLWAIFSWMPTWVQSLFPDPLMGQKERGAVMILLGSGGIVGGICSGFLINFMGYRKTLMLAFAGSFVMCFLLFKTNQEFNFAIYAETAFLALFFGISQGALSSYLPELFPTSIRATATGFCFNIGRLATAVVVFFVGALVTVLGGYGNAVLVFSITFLIGLLVTFYSREAIAHSDLSLKKNI
jgi:MFS family permease